MSVSNGEKGDIVIDGVLLMVLDYCLPPWPQRPRRSCDRGSAEKPPEFMADACLAQLDYTTDEGRQLTADHPSPAKTAPATPSPATDAPPPADALDLDGFGVDDLHPVASRKGDGFRSGDREAKSGGYKNE